MADLWEGKKIWPGDCRRDPTRHASPCPGDVDGGMDIAAATFAATNRSCARKALPPGRIAEFPVPWPHIAGSLLASSAPWPNRVTSPSSQPSSFRWNSRKLVLPKYHPTQDELVATVTDSQQFGARLVGHPGTKHIRLAWPEGAVPPALDAEAKRWPKRPGPVTVKLPLSGPNAITIVRIEEVKDEDAGQ